MEAIEVVVLYIKQDELKEVPRNDDHIMRRAEGRDIWICADRSSRGDKWFILEHWCDGRVIKQRKRCAYHVVEMA